MYCENYENDVSLINSQVSRTYIQYLTINIVSAFHLCDLARARIRRIQPDDSIKRY